MAATMSLLYQNSPVNIKIEQDSDDNCEHTAQHILVMRKKTKENQVTSMPEILNSEGKQVLGQLSMNHQKEPAAKKRRVSDGMSTKVKPPAAVAVARRNARERNRVKQVNNGFSMLRDHIPPEIAETFEQAGRGSAKKLSKVETLRMAVEYIRSLERMLALDTSNDSDPSSPPYNSTTFSNMSSISETSLPATPPPENQQPFFYALKPHSGVMETQITIIGGQQYIRIPGTNTFQLVTHDIFENDENIHPNAEYTTIQIHPPSSPATTAPLVLNNNNNNSNNSIASTMNFVNEINSSTSVINTTTETPAGSISPYSGHSSLSPAPSHHGTDNISNNNIIIEDGHLSCLTNASVASLNSDQKLPYADHLLMHCGSTETSHYENIILKQEIMDDDGIFDESSLSNENMIDAMQWWEQQQSLSHSGSS